MKQWQHKEAKRKTEAMLKSMKSRLCSLTALTAPYPPSSHLHTSYQEHNAGSVQPWKECNAISSRFTTALKWHHFIPYRTWWPVLLKLTFFFALKKKKTWIKISWHILQIIFYIFSSSWGICYIAEVRGQTTVLIWKRAFWSVIRHWTLINKKQIANRRDTELSK